ncbi:MULTISPECIES: DUF1464 family protein [Thermococcus]|uniref:Butyrate kinase n=1 Tax=Thermococcus sibiricus (strain DSM 12597 / MM 739) TaxID=604354 RepID=C6A3I6_THESM|nr:MULTISPECIES: DUF1464 family protein [Thermococcus]ACS90181.1 hypothetical protein TSIB_1127 [Thermococcus sibiricus MM 739]MBC7095020.1 DUF1464 family protein [Thermococcus sp.]
MRVIGVDPGTKSFDVIGLEDGRIRLDLTFPSEVVAEKPEQIVKVIENFDANLIIGPSGYGVPLKHISELTDKDRFEMTLVRGEEMKKIPVLIGLQKMVDEMAEKDMNVWFIPGVIHLPTVPEWRKYNKIDMGTADKMAITVLGIYDQAKRLGVEYNDVSFVLLEVGFGYNYAGGVKGGKIVDGIGGTIFPGPAYVNSGALDGEVAYLLGKVEKWHLFWGGATVIAANEILPPEEFAKRLDEESFSRAWEAMKDGFIKAVAAELAIVRNPREIVLSGRLMRIEELRKDVKDTFEELFGLPVVKQRGLEGKAKEAAQGSAIIADGLAGGEFKELVEHVEIRKSRGSILDYVKFPLGL